MSTELLGELVPIGGGDPIPLSREVMSIGRRESCDICLRFQNVSGRHCELSYQQGYWMIKDLQSSNGVKVNGERVTRKPLQPGDEIGIANHKYTIKYQLGLSNGLASALAEDEDIFGESLLQKAGLEKTEDVKKGPPPRRRS